MAFVVFGLALGLLAAAAIFSALSDKTIKATTATELNAAKEAPAQHLDASEDSNRLTESDVTIGQDDTVVESDEPTASAAENGAEQLVPQLPQMLVSDIRKALEKDETQLWNLNGMKGYVVLSESSSMSDQECRNVMITLITSHGQDQAEPELWCKPSAESDWSKAN